MIPTALAAVSRTPSGSLRDLELFEECPRPGTGVLAGAAVRAVVEGAGIQNILTKSIGSSNPINLVKAALDGLLQLRTRKEIEDLRGVTLDDDAGSAGFIQVVAPSAKQVSTAAAKAAARAVLEAPAAAPKATPQEKPAAPAPEKPAIQPEHDQETRVTERIEREEPAVPSTDAGEAPEAAPEAPSAPQAPSTGSG